MPPLPDLLVNRWGSAVIILHMESLGIYYSLASISTTRDLDWLSKGESRLGANLAEPSALDMYFKEC